MPLKCLCKTEKGISSLYCVQGYVHGIILFAVASKP